MLSLVSAKNVLNRRNGNLEISRNGTFGWENHSVTASDRLTGKSGIASLSREISVQSRLPQFFES